MYVDESGDPGLKGYSSPHYILSGIVISQAKWEHYLKELKAFRRELKQKYQLNQRTEIHAAELIRINKQKEYRKITKSDRIKILKEYCNAIPVIFEGSKIINVCLKKQDFRDDARIHEIAWHR